MKIIAIGGGEIGRPKTKIETESIDREIIRLSGKKHPKVLFIPTASLDSKSYYETFQNYYGKILECRTDVLYLIEETHTPEALEKIIMNTDIIYVGGGNTVEMLKIWKTQKIDEILKRAMDKGIILCGLSAGANCWFKSANSDLAKMKDEKSFVKIKGLGFIELMSCPHYDVEKDRRKSLHEMIKKKSEIAIALDNCSAIEIVGRRYKILVSNKDANAYVVYKKGKEVIEEKLPKDGVYRPIEELLDKK